MLKEMLPYFALIIAVTAILIGIAAMIFPVKLSVVFGIPVKGSETHYVRIAGVRDVFIGSVFLFLYFGDDFWTIGIVSFFVAFVSGFDLFMTRKYGLKLASYGHLIATILAVVYGYLLLVNF